MLDLFDECAPEFIPNLRYFVELGDLAKALDYVEKNKYDEVLEEALRLGFYIVGSRRNKADFYTHLGQQLIEACKWKRTPIQAIPRKNDFKKQLASLASLNLAPEKRRLICCQNIALRWNLPIAVVQKIFDEKNCEV